MDTAALLHDAHERLGRVVLAQHLPHVLLRDVAAEEHVAGREDAAHHLDRGRGEVDEQRGLDRETNKALLMQHLTDRGAEGAPIRDLLQALPALSRDQVKRLLRELAVEGRAQVIGVTRAGRWFAIGKAGRIGSAGDDDPRKLQ